MPHVSALTKKKKRIKAKGGWFLRIPDIETFDSLTMKIYGRFHQSQGMTPVRAEKEVLDTFNEMWQVAWVRYQTNSLRYWMKRYAERFPLKVQEDGFLEDFRPEWIQDTYVPGMNSGKAGKKIMNDLLGKMARGEER